MKKFIVSTLMIMLVLSLTVSAATLGKLEWQPMLENTWELTESGSVRTVASDNSAMSNFCIAVNNGQKFSGDFEVEVDMPMVERDYVTITLNAARVDAYSGTMIKLHPTFGIILYDIDSEVTVAPEYASTTDTTAGMDAFEPFQKVKVTKVNGLVTIYVNGVKNFEFTPVNCDDEGMIVLGAQIPGNKTCEFRNFKLTVGGETYTDFEVGASSVSSVPDEPVSSADETPVSSAAAAVSSQASSASQSSGCGNNAQ